MLCLDERKRAKEIEREREREERRLVKEFVITSKLPVDDYWQTY